MYMFLVSKKKINKSRIRLVFLFSVSLSAKYFERSHPGYIIRMDNLIGKTEHLQSSDELIRKQDFIQIR